MENIGLIKENISSFNVANIEMIPFVVDLLISAALAGLLVVTYRKFGRTISNRVKFSNNFIMITATTMVIITIVKSSLALSLGLVGALSIVRFRAAIKEPEELAYLFLCIAIGLGLGAQQRSITIIGAIVILVIILATSLSAKKIKNSPNLYLNIKNESKKILLTEITKILNKSCSSVELIRLDDDSKTNEYLFNIELYNIKSLEKCREDLHSLGDVEISLLEKKD